MDEIKLEVQIREEIGSQRMRRVRGEDFIPGIVYGGDKKPTAIKVDRRTFERIERQHRGESFVLRLNVMEGEKKLRDYATIIKELQLDPVSDGILHIDFNRISLTEELEVKVPIVAKGEPVGVKQDGGSLDHQLWELDVVCLPTNIPQNIEVDVNALNIHDAIHVKDLVLPAGVKTNHDPETVVFSVAAPMKEIEEEPVAEEEGAAEEPEVIKKEKKDDGEEPTEQPQAQEKAEG